MPISLNTLSYKEFIQKSKEWQVWPAWGREKSITIANSLEESITKYGEDM